MDQIEGKQSTGIETRPRWNWPPATLFSGLLLLTAIENALLTGEFWGKASGSFQTVGTVYALASAVTLLAVAAAAKRRPAQAPSLRMYGGFAALLVGATGLLLVGELVSGPASTALAVVAALLAAAGYNPLVLSWVALYGHLPMRTVFMCFAVAYGGGSVLSWALVVLEPKWMVDVILAVAVLASLLSFRRAQEWVEEHGRGDADEEVAASAVVPFPVKPVVICGVVAFVTTFMQNYGPMADVPLANFVGALIAVAVLGLLLVGRRTHLMGLQQVSLVLAVSSVQLCLPFVDTAVGIAGMALSMAANLVFLVFAETVLCGIALRYRYSAPWLVGVSLAVMAVASFLAVAASETLQQRALGTADITLLAAAMAIAVLVLFLRFVTEADVVGAWGMGDAAPENGRPSAPERSVPLRVFDLSCQFGLTKREEEVCALLAQGHNVAGIEEVLVVSNSTAKSHVAHIYKKLGVHSIQEFRDLFDGE